MRESEKKVFSAIVLTVMCVLLGHSATFAGAPSERHWAFIRPQRPALPRVKDTAWPRNPIDYFILARLESEPLRPAPQADDLTLVRRLSLDLRGLPPTVEEADRFAQDARAAAGRTGAYQRVVDRFLSDPAYGEKMASYWLDLARFGDTNGYQDDGNRVMWPYRDYVVGAFNENRPFDQFTVENVAGDLLPEGTIEQIIASGFNRNHRFNEEGGADPEEFRVAYSVDRANTTATTWLGLTFECAQCHDHKYDPLTQSEYYQFYAFFNSNKDELGVSKASRQPPFIELPTPEEAARREELTARIAPIKARAKALEPEVDAALARWRKHGELSGDEALEIEKEKGLSRIFALAELSDKETDRLRRFYAKHHAPEYAGVMKQLEELGREKKAIERAMATTLVMGKMSPRRPAFLLERGDYRRQGEALTPNVPAIFPPLRQGMEHDRLALAYWLIDPEHPLVARVAVNRIWQQFFGKGIVKTANDFGTRGDPPSHPKLLDWLATELVRSGWDIKAIQRLVVTSATYRQSSIFGSAGSVDPTNSLFHRAARFRLRAEEVRDNALAVAGLLWRKVGGASFMPYQPEGYFSDKSREWKWNVSQGAAQYRRGLYTFWRRTTPHPSLVTFDAPSRELCVVDRARTISPQQALVTLNDPVFVEAARVFAERVLADGPAGRQAKLTYAFRLALTSAPRPDQVELLTSVHREEYERYRGEPEAARRLVAVGQAPRRSGLADVELAAWTSVTNVLLNLDRTITRD